MSDRKKLEKALEAQVERYTKLDPKGDVLATLFENEVEAFSLFPMSFIFMLEEAAESFGAYQLISANISDFTDKSVIKLTEKLSALKDADVKKLVKKAEDEAKASAERVKERRASRVNFLKGHITQRPKGINKAFELWTSLKRDYAPEGLGLMDVTPHDSPELMASKLRANIELLTNHFGISNTVRELCSNIGWHLEAMGPTTFEVHRIPQTYPNYYGVTQVEDNGTMLEVNSKRDTTLHPGHVYTIPLDISGGMMDNIEIFESTFPIDVEVSLGSIKRNISLIVDMSRAGRAHDISKDMMLAIISY